MRFGRHPKHFSVRIKDFLYCVRAQFLRPFFARTVSPLYFVHENLLGTAPQPPRQ